MAQAIRRQEGVDLINRGRFRVAFRPLFWTSVFVSLIPFPLLLAPDNRLTLGVLFGASVVLFCSFAAISAYDVWVAGRASNLDTPRVLKRRSLFVFYASNVVVPIVLPFLVNRLHIAFVLVSLVLTRILVPWVVAAVSTKLPFDSLITRA